MNIERVYRMRRHHYKCSQYYKLALLSMRNMQTHYN